MPWTDPIYTGDATPGLSYDWNLYDWNNLENSTGAALTAYWGPNTTFTSQYLDSTEVDLTNWSVTIPGGGNNVTNIKVRFECRETTGWTDPGINVYFSQGNSGDYIQMSSGATWSFRSITDTPTGWGLTGAEIDNLVSNSASYGISIYTFQPATKRTPTINETVEIRHVTLEFEYNPVGGGILLAT